MPCQNAPCKPNCIDLIQTTERGLSSTAVYKKLGAMYPRFRKVKLVWLIWHSSFHPANCHKHPNSLQLARSRQHRFITQRRSHHPCHHGLQILIVETSIPTCSDVWKCGTPWHHGTPQFDDQSSVSPISWYLMAIIGGIPNFQTNPDQFGTAKWTYSQTGNTLSTYLHLYLLGLPFCIVDFVGQSSFFPAIRNMISIKSSSAEKTKIPKPRPRRPPFPPASEGPGLRRMAVMAMGIGW